MRRDPRLGRLLLALGVVVLALAALDVRSPWRPILTLAFFCVGPGAAIVPHLGIREPLLAASLVIAISVVVGMATAMGMLWAGVSSPVAGPAVVLVVTALALGRSPAAGVEEVRK